jgi:hypothetical protein
MNDIYIHKIHIVTTRFCKYFLYLLKINGYTSM